MILGTPQCTGLTINATESSSYYKTNIKDRSFDDFISKINKVNQVKLKLSCFSSRNIEELKAVVTNCKNYIENKENKGQKKTVYEKEFLKQFFKKERINVEVLKKASSVRQALECILHPTKVSV